MVKNIPIYQDPDTLEGQTQQFVPNPVPDTTGKDQSVGIPTPSTQPEDLPTNPVPAPAAPTTVISDAPTQEPISKTDEILKRMYATREPAPVLDVQKQDRLRRMGNVNAIGRGVSLLSDALSLGLGGNVKRRAPDQMGPALYQNYQNMLDRYKGEQDQFNYRDVSNQRNNLRMELSDQYKKDADKLRREQMDIQAKIAAAKDQTERQRWMLQFDQKERDLAEREKQHKDDIKLGYSRIAASAKNKTTAEGKPFTQVSINGKDVNLTQGQHRGLLAEATASGAFTNEDLLATEAAYTNSPLEGEKNIIQRYLNWKKQSAIDESIKNAAAGQTSQLTEGAVSSAFQFPKPGTTVGTGPSSIPAHAQQPVGTETGPAVGSHAKKVKTPSFFQ